MMFDVHSIDELLARKPNGHFRVEAFAGQITITIIRPGEHDEVLFCRTRGHANQLRQALSDEGLAGLIEGAL